MTIEEVHEILSSDLARIARMFLPGAKITLIVRHEGYPERDLFMSDDTLEGAQAVLTRSVARATPVKHS
jgi:hypothetical protein